jgi:hypothetical protein
VSDRRGRHFVSVVVALTRPIYPYPLRAKYTGSGDPKEAANSKAVGPR